MALVLAVDLRVVRCVDTACEHAQNTVQERCGALHFDNFIGATAHGGSVNSLCLAQTAHKEGLHIFFSQLASLAVDVGGLC